MMVKIKFNNENIADALIGALEGGSNYWYFLPDVSMVKKIDNKLLESVMKKEVKKHKMSSTDLYGKKENYLRQ